MKRTAGLFFLTVILVAGTGEADEPVLGGPCEGCENVFEGLPTHLESRARIAPAKAPGEPLVIEGTVRAQSGGVAQGIIVYAYHTDSTGIYPRGVTRHGRLRGWARTDADGRYRFDTIRPGAYPGSSNPQHVHMHIVEPGKGTYYIDDIVFEDDPLLTPRQKRQHARGRGGSGLCSPEKDDDGIWHVRRDITLGAGVPDYPDEPASASQPN